MKVFPITIITFKEAIRDKILYNLLLFALLMIGVAVLVGEATIGDWVKVTKDMGLASISIFGVLIAIFVGIGLVYKEIDKKTIYTIISKPIQRYQFLLGKYFGLLLTLFVNVFIMTLGLFMILFFVQAIFDPRLLLAIWLIFIELMVITSVAILFSTFSTPTLSAMFTLAFYVIGHFSVDLKYFGAKSEILGMKYLTNILYYVLPNLDNFNIKGKIVHQLPVSNEYLLYSSLYGLLYIIVVLLISMIIFQRRDFK